MIRIVFDGPPGPEPGRFVEAGRFVEVEDSDGNSFRAGEWKTHPDNIGFWVLEIDDDDEIRKQRDALAQKLADMPCPECKGKGNMHIYVAGILREPRPCTHCGEFPEPRRGFYAIDTPDALRRVAETDKEE